MRATMIRRAEGASGNRYRHTRLSCGTWRALVAVGVQWFAFCFFYEERREGWVLLNSIDDV